MQLKPLKRAALPVAITLALGGGLTACSDSQRSTSSQPQQQSSAAANPCAAAQPSSPSKTSNPCAAAKPGTGQTASTANPCAASSKAAPESAAVPNPPAKSRSDRSLPFAIENDWTMAPYGDAMPAIVDNYNRPASFIASGGLIKEGAMPQLRELGFKTVVSLLTPEEGLAEEEKAAHAAGLNFFGLGVSTRAPNWDQVEAFARIASSPENYPILVHCASSNRVGAMWALYRHYMGVPAEIAIEEGHGAGLKTSREGAVRELMGLSGQG